MITRGELDLRTNQLANAFLGSGLEPGHRVAVWIEDAVEGIETYLALSKASLVAAPIGKLLTAEEGAHVLNDVDARGVVFTSGLADRVGTAIEASNCEPGVLLGIDNASLDGSTAYDDALAGPRATMPAARQRQQDQDVLIGYTSGTTGFPKGALIREQSLSAATQ